MASRKIIDRLRIAWRNGLRPASPAAFGFALLCITAATIVCLAVDLLLPGFMTHATFYPAILLATLVGGAWAGGFALLLGGIVGWWVFGPLYLGGAAASAPTTLSICFSTSP